VQAWGGDWSESRKYLRIPVFCGDRSSRWREPACGVRHARSVQTSTKPAVLTVGGSLKYFQLLSGWSWKMGYALKIYEAFRDLGEDKASALAEFVEYVESRKSATSEELKETELRLQKEIEQVRKELKETELKLQKEIEQVRKELKETELRLQKEIEQVRKELKETELRLQKEIEQVRLEVEGVRKELKETELRLQKEIGETKASLIKWMFLFWTGQIIAFAGLLKFMLH
jgi:predicted  nucleic acid-binding Zn-ribbon protein